MRYKVTVGGRERDVDVLLSPDGRVVAATLDGASVPIEVVEVPGGVSLRIAGRVAEVLVAGKPDALDVASGEARARVSVVGDRARMATRPGASRAGSREIRTPMPGRVVRVLVAEGELVTQGQPVVVVEAMKMENELRAQLSGEVAAVLVKAGDTVDGNAVLVRLA